MAGGVAGDSIRTTYRPCALGWCKETSRSFGGEAQAASAIVRIAVDRNQVLEQARDSDRLALASGPEEHARRANRDMVVYLM